MNIADLLARYEAGESMAALAAEAGVSRVTMWRRLGRPARYRLEQPTIEPEETFKAWAAGFIDGEGCIHIGKDGRLSLSVVQTVLEPLEALCAAYGGNVRVKPSDNPRHKGQWRWELAGEAAGMVLGSVRPYLRVKQRHADLALGVLGLRRGRGLRLDDNDRAERAAYAAAMADLNHRGRRAEPST